MSFQQETNYEKGRRIAKNTILLYVRSIINLLISLLTSRFVLQSLGVDDFGVYNAVAGFVSMFWLVSGSLSTATSRFMNYEMGRDNREKLHNVFSLSLTLLCILAMLALLLTESIGIWFLHNKMVIPEGRDFAAGVVFQFAVLELVLGFIVVPFSAAIISHEDMKVYSLVSIMETFLKFGIALLLISGCLHVDKLIAYGVLCLCMTTISKAISVWYSLHHYDECRLSLYFEKGLFKEMFGYSSANFLCSISSVFSGQGVNMILNIYFGPVVNAARGLASTVNQSVALLVGNFTIALNPQITKSYASGDSFFFRTLLFSGSKFSFFLFFFFACPLLIETPIVLEYWLGAGSVPEYTVAFVRLALINHLFTLFKGVFPSGIMACGKVLYMYILMSVLDILNFPLSLLAIKQGLPPEVVYIISILLLTLQTIGIFYLVKRQLGFSFIEIFNSVLFRILLTVLITLPLPIIVHMAMTQGFLRLLFVCVVSVITCLFAAFAAGCTQEERLLIRSFVKKKLGI